MLVISLIENGDELRLPKIIFGCLKHNVVHAFNHLPYFFFAHLPMALLGTNDQILRVKISNLDLISLNVLHFLHGLLRMLNTRSNL